MNILILGGSGFLGNNLIRRCLKDPKNKVGIIKNPISRKFKWWHILIVICFGVLYYFIFR